MMLNGIYRKVEDVCKNMLAGKLVDDA